MAQLSQGQLCPRRVCATPDPYLPYMLPWGLHQLLQAKKAITPAVVPAGLSYKAGVLGFETATTLLS